ncbi:double-stranded RNA-binding protein 1-like [Mangifera indica]|uniref:double-stranded RNA-binding protein 1-like n=1 Tax=Mangifera indica TaxID=29780 RepID=UPI001CF9EC8C|nr:double-stranded RNA-binding protein 1-like [Mangifera indica]
MKKRKKTTLPFRPYWIKLQVMMLSSRFLGMNLVSCKALLQTPSACSCSPVPVPEYSPSQSEVSAYFLCRQGFLRRFSSSVSNCCLFKSRLQEYAQKMGLQTPVYETTKEGPSHEPSFRSAVVVNDVRYESLPDFFNRKAAEQSAAEVALMELAKLGQVNPSISHPVHETGLCKNLLREYAQKMNYAIPMYRCQKDEAPGQVPHFSCTVEIGGIQYIGAAARTKKEAEIKATRTTLLAIQSSASELSGSPSGNSQLTVIPCRKRGTESVDKPKVDETVNVPKPKKARCLCLWWHAGYLRVGAIAKQSCVCCAL